MDRVNLESLARDMLGEVIAYDMKTLDIDALRDGIGDAAHQAADNACIYTSTCFQIIDDYESRPEVPNESDFGGEYKAHQYREAATAWAYEVAYSVLCAEAAETVEEIAEKAANLCGALCEAGRSVDESDLAVTRDCPHGWAPHDKEDADGTHYWSAPHLEGCNALAIDAGPFWLSYTWTPEPNETGATA